MSRGQFFRSFWFQEGLRLLVIEALIILVTWLIYRQQRYVFSDVLFLVGAGALMLAAFGMLRGDADLGEDGRRHGPRFSVQPTEGDAESDARYKMSFGARLAICGGFSILIALLMYLINKAGG